MIKEKGFTYVAAKMENLQCPMNLMIRKGPPVWDLRKLPPIQTNIQKRGLGFKSSLASNLGMRTNCL